MPPQVWYSSVWNILKKLLVNVDSCFILEKPFQFLCILPKHKILTLIIRRWIKKRSNQIHGNHSCKWFLNIWRSSFGRASSYKWVRDNIPIALKWYSCPGSWSRSLSFELHPILLTSMRGLRCSGTFSNFSGLSAWISFSRVWNRVGLLPYPGHHHRRAYRTCFSLAFSSAWVIKVWRFGP